MIKTFSLAAGFLVAIGLASTDASAAKASADDQCPAFLNHEYRKLHSQERVNLCEKYRGKPLVIVNTASYCGFTPQFTGLENLYQKYKEKGVEVIGFASNDFNQEDKNEAKTAGVCFKNYGVTFTMVAPTRVKGDEANPTFAHLGRASKAPGWNFHKYLISDAGSTIKHYDSRVKPLASDLENDLVEALN